MVPSARRRADLPATSVGADRLRVKVSAWAKAGPADVASARTATAAARVYLAFMRVAKLRAALNGTSTRRLREHHGRLDLALRDVPVRPQQLGRALGAHVLEAVALVEPNSPRGRGPGAHQHRPCGDSQQVLEQRAADAPALRLRNDIRVPDEVHVSNRLDAHDPDEPPG